MSQYDDRNDCLECSLGSSCLRHVPFPSLDEKVSRLAAEALNAAEARGYARGVADAARVVEQEPDGFSGTLWFRNRAVELIRALAPPATAGGGE